ncbi:MAG: exonuclease sbcCD subunit D, partial [Clostridiales bacterium]|nr:exonuclease sbcCD subunit D [Clostridiales bacterium]
PNLMLLNYDNKRTQTDNSVIGIDDVNRYTPVQLFNMLYEEQNGQPISDIQRDYLSDLIEQIWGAEK